MGACCCCLKSEDQETEPILAETDDGDENSLSNEINFFKYFCFCCFKSEPNRPLTRPPSVSDFDTDSTTSGKLY